MRRGGRFDVLLDGMRNEWRMNSAAHGGEGGTN